MSSGAIASEGSSRSRANSPKLGRDQSLDSNKSPGPNSPIYFRDDNEVVDGIDGEDNAIGPDVRDERKGDDAPQALAKESYRDLLFRRRGNVKNKGGKQGDMSALSDGGYDVEDAGDSDDDGAKHEVRSLGDEHDHEFDSDASWLAERDDEQNGSGVDRRRGSDLNGGISPTVFSTEDILTRRFDVSQVKEESKSSFLFKYFPDVMWANYHERVVNLETDLPVSVKADFYGSLGISEEDVKALVMNAPSVVDAQNRDFAHWKERNAGDVLSSIVSSPNPKTVRFMSWVLSKLFSKLFTRFAVHEAGVKRVIEAAREGTVVFAPTHKSQLDYLILSYVCFTYGLPLPHVAAADSMKVPVIGWLLKKSGAFFMRPHADGDTLYEMVYLEYVKSLVTLGCSLEFFIEGTRSRTGKLLPPQLDLLTAICEAAMEVNDGESTNLSTRPNVTSTGSQLTQIIPLSITYDRVLETLRDGVEKMHEPTSADSMSAFFSTLNGLSETLGEVHVIFGEPIPVQDTLVRLHAAESPKQGSLSSGGDRIGKMAEVVTAGIVGTQVIPPTALVAALLLSSDHNEWWSVSELCTRAGWLWREIAVRGGKLTFGVEEVSVQARRAIQLLLDCVDTKGEMVDRLLRVTSDPQNRLQLAFYRNHLHHVFYQESFVACAAFASLSAEFRKTGSTASVSRRSLVEDALFLADLLSLEVSADQANCFDETAVNEALSVLVARGSLVIVADDEARRQLEGHAPGDDEQKKADNEDSDRIQYSLGPNMELTRFLVDMTAPIIDMYYATLIGLGFLSLHGTEQYPTEILVDRIRNLSVMLHRDHGFSLDSIGSQSVNNALDRFSKMKLLSRATVRTPKGGVQELIQLCQELSDDAKEQESVYVTALKRIGAVRPLASPVLGFVYDATGMSTSEGFCAVGSTYFDSVARVEGYIVSLLFGNPKAWA